MKSLAIALVILTVSALAVTRQRSQWSDLQQQIAQCHTVEDQCRRELVERRDSLALLVRETAQSDREADQLQVDLRAVADEAERFPPELRPDHEGNWPEALPYFFLHKRHLTNISFALLQADGHLTPESRSVLGLSPGEQRAVEECWARFHQDLRRFQRATAEPLPDSESWMTPGRQMIQFRLPRTADEIAILREELETGLQTALGTLRAGIVYHGLNVPIGKLLPPITDRDCLITLLAERHPDGSLRHDLRIAEASAPVPFPHSQDLAESFSLRPEGGGFTFRDIVFPLTPSSPLWNYRHLFGDQPLME